MSERQVLRGSWRERLTHLIRRAFQTPFAFFLNQGKCQKARAFSVLWVFFVKSVPQIKRKTL